MIIGSSPLEHENKVCRKVTEVDYLINMPVLKAHCGHHLRHENLKGCIPMRKTAFSPYDLHYPLLV